MCALMCLWVVVFGVRCYEQGRGEEKVWNNKEIEILNFFKLGFFDNSVLEIHLGRVVYTLFREEIMGGEK